LQVRERIAINGKQSEFAVTARADNAPGNSCYGFSRLGRLAASQYTDFSQGEYRGMAWTELRAITPGVGALLFLAEQHSGF